MPKLLHITEAELRIPILPGADEKQQETTAPEVVESRIDADTGEYTGALLGGERRSIRAPVESRRLAPYDAQSLGTVLRLPRSPSVGHGRPTSDRLASINVSE